MEAVKEAAPPVSDHTAADPMLVAPAAREQWLHESPSTTSAAAIEPVPIQGALPARTGESRFVIVGGAEGVSVVEQTRKRPVLRGGFGR